MSLPGREARAQYALHWVRGQGAERCIAPRRLAERIEAMLGPVFVPPAEAEIQLEGQVLAARHGGFRVRLARSERDGEPGGQRQLTTSSEDCHTLDASIAFVIAITLDPGLSLPDGVATVLSQLTEEASPDEVLLAELSGSSSVEHSARRDVLTEPAPHAAGPVEEPPQAVRRTQPEPESRVRYALDLSVATLGRTLPAWPFGARGALRRNGETFASFALTLSAFPKTTSHLVREGSETQLAAYEVGLLFCPRGRWGGVEVGGCLGSALAYLRGRGRGFDSELSAGLWDPVLALGPLFAWSLGAGFGVVADALLRLRVTQRAFAFLAADDTTRVAYRPARLGVLLSLGPRYEF